MTGLLPRLAMLLAALLIVIGILVPPASFMSYTDGSSNIVYNFAWSPIERAAGSTVGSGTMVEPLTSRFISSFFILGVPALLLVLLLLAGRLEHFGLRIGLRIALGLFLALSIIVCALIHTTSDVYVFSNAGEDVPFGGNDVLRMPK